MFSTPGRFSRPAMRQRQHASTITRKINGRARARVLGRSGREPLVQTGLLHGEVGNRDAWCFNFFPFSTDAPVTAAKIRPAAPSASMRIISMAIPIASCAISPSNSAVAAAAIRTSLRKRVGRRQKRPQQNNRSEAKAAHAYSPIRCEKYQLQF